MSIETSKKFKTAYGFLLLICATVAFSYAFRYTAGGDFWYDEVFSLVFAKKSLGEIMAFTARDVHPPLYYFYLKLVTSLGTAFGGEGAFVPSAKIASLLPLLILILISIFYIRKRFGVFTAGLFAFLIVFMPQLLTYFVEIRMYSLALLLITVHILLAESIAGASKDASLLKMFFFFLLGILTAYTQYYACIATVGIYIGTAIILLVQKKSKNDFVKLSICAAASVVTYLPWLPIIKNQAENISGSYWIQPLTLRSLAGCAKFILLPSIYVGMKEAVVIGLELICIAAAVFWNLKSGDKKSFLRAAVIGLMPIIIVVISGFVLSALGTPIFVYRYLVPTLGGCWLLVAIVIGKAADKRLALGIAFTLPFIMAGVMCIKNFDAEESKKLTQIPIAESALADIPEGSVLITNFDHVTAVAGMLRPDCEVYLYKQGMDKLLPDMLGNVQDKADDAKVKELVTANDNVFFLGSFNSREEIVADWEKLGIENTLLADILIERYWIDIYELK